MVAQLGLFVKRYFYVRRGGNGRCHEAVDACIFSSITCNSNFGLLSVYNSCCCEFHLAEATADRSYRGRVFCVVYFLPKVR